MTAAPTKLRDGSWGARVSGSVREGDTVTIQTRAGKSWTATVRRVVWSGDGVSIVATETTDRPARRSSRSSNGECQCGACEDLLSLGYRPGQRIRCDLCGGWAEVVLTPDSRRESGRISIRPAGIQSEKRR